MRIAAIDVGTNSVHLSVADISPDGEIQVVEKLREQVELGAGGLGNQRLTDAAFARGVAALVAFKEAASSLGAEEINAAATSAVREAVNGSDFVKAVRARTGIHIRAISGVEEARLIYLGARADLDFSAGNVLLMDLGGGSVEFIHCNTQRPLTSLSVPLGHIRLAEAFHRSDPLKKDEIKGMRAAIREQLAPLLQRVRPGDFATLVGTSGAIRTLGRMGTLLRGEALPEHAQGLVLHRPELDELISVFSSRKRARYASIPGMDSRRLRTLPSAAVLVREVMALFDHPTLQTSERSLRDGLLVDWTLRHKPEIQLAGAIPHPRMRAVRRLMERFGVDEAHAEKVRSLALQIFDATVPLHGLEPRDRRMLEYAALLHDVGHHIAGADHNKHGEYLIRYTPLHGFTAPEVAVLANLVRYHRGPTPKRKHVAFRALPQPDRRKVRILAGILRVADAYDRSHTQPVQELRIHLGPDGAVHITGVAVEQAHIERWAAERRRDLLQDALRRPVHVALQDAGDPP